MPLLALGVSGCNSDDGIGVDMAQSLAPKAVYTMSNDASDNRIFAYARAADGSLTALGSYSTGGKGSANGLASQNALIFDSARSLFFAVNAGDNSISMLSLTQDGSIALLANAPSGGIRPVSITVYGSYVYALNAGDANTAGNITGLQVIGNSLRAIQGSTKPLSTAVVSPAQIQFTPSGNYLVVTEKMTNKIDTFAVTLGIPSSANVQASNGVSPYGFAFSATGQLIVAEAALGMLNQGSASSYTVDANGTLTSVSNKVTSGQTASCWVTIVNNIAYITNALTNNVTAYSVSPSGALTLLASGISGSTGMGPADEDATDGNDFLYVLNTRDHSFSIFGINGDGTLTRKPNFIGLPAAAVGVVAR